MAESSEPAACKFPVTWDRYQCTGFLGEGAMGSVFEAYDPRLKRYVAIKFIRNEAADATERILREARAQARIDHPQICKVHEVGKVEGYLYIVMERIVGRRLDEVAGEMNLEEKVKLVQKAAEAVHAAHRTGLIHRDLKPGNIMVRLDEDGRRLPYVIDFGLARPMLAKGTTVTGELRGTPLYMAPEQVRGEIRALDRRTDVYSLGCTLYELLTGKPPFKGPNLTTVLVKILGEEPPPPRRIDPTIPIDLETIVLKCLEKDPQQRYTSARALANDLERYLDGEPVLAKPPSWAYRMKKKALKNKKLLSVLVAAGLAVLISLAWGLVSWWTAAERARLARLFGEQSREVEALVRQAKMLPLHDIRETQAVIDERLNAIRTRMENAGPLGEGPGHYALGRGYLAMNQPSLALDHLQRAWDEGFREAGASYALGRVYGDLYRHELRTAEQIRSQSVRGARIRQAETRYRQPALEFLRQSDVGDMESAAYGEALLAFYEGRYEEALERVGGILSRMPWLFEARKLEGDLLTARGNAFRDAGQYQDAVLSYSQGRQAYDQAAGIARSDAQIYQALGALGVSLLKLARLTSEVDWQEGLAWVVRGCELALRVDPTAAEAHWLAAVAHTMAGEQEAARGGDPHPLWHKAIAHAQQALALRPDYADAYNSLGMAHDTIARHELAQGGDPRLHLEHAILAHEKALAVNPNLFEARNNLALSHLYLARYELNHGRDPLPDLAHAEQAFLETIASHREGTSAYINLGVTYRIWARYVLDGGGDPRELLDKAVAIYKRALEQNPNHMATHYSLGNVHQTLSEYDLVRGRDPLEHVQRALKAFQKARELQPKSHLVENALGAALLYRSRRALQFGEDPRPFLKEAVSNFEEATHRNPKDKLAAYNRLFTHWLWATYDFNQGRDPAEQVAMGKIAAQMALDLDPGFTEALGGLGDLHLVTAETLVTHDQDPLSVFEESSKAYAQALGLNPRYSRALLGLGRVGAGRARFAIQRGRSPEKEFQQSLDYMRQARELQPNAVVYALATAEVLVQRANWQVEKTAQLADVEAGMNMVNQARRFNADQPEALALEAQFLFIQARDLPDPERRNWLERAGKLLKTAWEANPHLQHKYRPLE